MSKRSNKPTSLEDMIAAIPDKKCRKINWTMAEDAAILKYGETKGFRAIAEVMGKNASAVHSRFHFLKAQIK